MTNTPMTPDQSTPVELTLQQIETLAAAGNRAVNDEIHEELCACDVWPTGCVSHSDVSQGYWDMGRIETALPAVIGVWETLRNDRHKAKVAELRADNNTLRTRVAELEEQQRFQERNTLPDLHRQIEHHQDGKARWRKRAETAEARVAELTTAPADEAAELAETEAEVEAMRREHPAPCRVPDSPDCTCPDKLPVFTGADWDGPIARCSWGTHMAALLPSGRIARHRMGEGWLNACPGVGKPPRAEEETAS